MEKLTKVQQIVLTYIETYISEVGYSPVEEEIQKHMGYASKNAAREILKVIKRKGYINTTPNVARSIVVLTESNGWISIDDRLPKDRISVLCLSIHKVIYAAYYTFDSQEFYPYAHLTSETPVGVVTHWQEQPQPPTT